MNKTPFSLGDKSGGENHMIKSVIGQYNLRVTCRGGIVLFAEGKAELSVLDVVIAVVGNASAYRRRRTVAGAHCVIKVVLSVALYVRAGAY